MPEKFIICGQNPLRGEMEVRGSKNAASKMMVASLLTDEPCVLENVPLSGETAIAKELCETIGSQVECTPDRRCVLETKEVRTSLVSEFSKRNRIPILTLGPLLHRRGMAEVPIPGGDYLGHRPINFHVEALEKMGVKIERREHSFFAQADSIHGAEITFPYPSVGATENVLLTAVLAKGKTTIKNAATEPEIANLIAMLVSMGGRIYIDSAERLIEIEGVEKLHGAEARVMPDRNEVVSFASAGLATGGDVFIRDIEASYLSSFLEKLKELGVSTEVQEGGIRFMGRPSFDSVFVETSPYPGFMTDWQQPLSILLTQGRGTSIIHETVYEDRFGYAKDLNRMGAEIKVADECPARRKCRFDGRHYCHTAYVSGPKVLRGCDMVMTDIRAGMAHIIAALSAEGESVISGIEHIDRGYEKIDERLKALGANIERVPSEEDVELKAQSSNVKATA